MPGPVGGAEKGGLGGSGDRFDLGRFTRAQEGIFERALGELRAGQKRTHWMWFIFPQIAGLGQSSTSRRYAIRSLEEAMHYLGHPVLGGRLRQCCQALLGLKGRSVSQIFGYPDDLKLKSSMTLFARAAAESGESPSPFDEVLDKYFGGQRDGKTLDILQRLR
jgi:uncharacterized protein (DUF1810 family)